MMPPVFPCPSWKAWFPPKLCPISCASSFQKVEVCELRAVERDDEHSTPIHAYPTVPDRKQLDASIHSAFFLVCAELRQLVNWSSRFVMDPELEQALFQDSEPELVRITTSISCAFTLKLAP